MVRDHFHLVKIDNESSFSLWHCRPVPCSKRKFGAHFWLNPVNEDQPWPDLPDDSDGWLPPRSVFTEDWVRGLDDEQRCG